MQSVPVLTALGSAGQEEHLRGKTGMPRSDIASLPAPVLGILQIFLLACPSAIWPTLSLDTFRYVPIRH